jgi:hypothetical protein
MKQPPIPSHGRILGLLGVALTLARNPRDSSKAMSAIRDELESILKNSRFCEGQGFSWITIAVRFGLKDDAEPRFGKVNRKYGDLPLSIEIDSHRLEGRQLDQLIPILRTAVLLALIHVGKKYHCDVRPLMDLQ